MGVRRSHFFTVGGTIEPGSKGAALGEWSMPTIKAVGQGRSVDGGNAIEVDFVLTDDSPHTLKIPFENVPRTMHAISQSASVAETAQRVSISGQSQFAVIVPYRATDVRTGHSSDRQIAVAFSTAQGPVQIAMSADLTRLTIERLTSELGQLDKPRQPKLS
jgi:hypothetical protein